MNLISYPTHLYIQGVAKRLLNFVSLSVTHFLELSCCFCAHLTVNYGRFFTLVLFGFKNEHIFWKYNPGKMLDFRVAKIGSFLACWILRVANFGINYLRHFFINFKNFCAHCAANFLNFPKHPHYITFWWFWRKLWPKIRKLRNQKICQFEPTLKSSLFSGWNFSTFFSSLCPKSTKVKNRPYLTVKRAQKHLENSI